MNDISSMDKTFIILVGIFTIWDIACRVVEYLRYKEKLKNEGDKND